MSEMRTGNKRRITVFCFAVCLGALVTASSTLAAYFDNDTKSDVAVWRKDTGVWYVQRSSDGGMLSPQWGLGSLGDNAVAGDYDGDGKTDVAVWRPSNGVWYIQKSSDGGMLSPQWGLGSLGDVPVPGDYDGDGKTDVAVWRPDSGVWYIQKSTDGGMLSPQWGLGSLGDVPVPGDYDKDGKTDVAVWRPSSGVWYIQKSTDGGMLSPQWGLGSLGDVPVPGDYDGDGNTDVAVWRPDSGVWYIQKSTDGGMLSPQWGMGSLGDVPVPGDYDGDGKTDVAVWRPDSGVWYIQKSTDGGMLSPQWGLGSLNDVPALGAAGLSSARNRVYDIRDYIPLRVGDYAIRQDGYTEITLRTERLSYRNTPFTLIRGFQYDPGGGGEVFDDVFGFRLNNGTMTMQGNYRGTPRVFYRNTPSIMIGSSSMRVGDTFNNTYTVTNTNTGDNTIESFSGTFAAIETVITPAGTFANCMKYIGTSANGTWTAWFAPGIGQVKEITSGGTENPAVYIVADNVAYGTPPAFAVSNVSGMFESDVNLATSGNGGTRWEKEVHNFVHDSGTGGLDVIRFRPDGSQAPRTGTLTDSAFTMTGLSGAGGQPLTSSGIFTPDGKHFVGRWWYDASPDVQYAYAGNIINAVPGRSTGDENISASTCETGGYFREVFTGPLAYNGYVNAYRKDTYSGLDPGAPVNESYWTWNDSNGNTYMIGVSGGPIPPILMMPSRFVLDNVYTTADMGGGNTKKIKVDAVQSATAPLGTYPLSLRVNFQDNVAGTVTTSYQWGAPGVNLRLKYTDPGCNDSLVWFRSSGNTFGNKPTLVPFSIKYTNSGYLYLRDESDGTRRYWYDVEVKTPAGGMVADNTTVQDVKVYAWPSMTAVPLLGSWTTWRGPDLYFDGDGNGANSPFHLPYSGLEGYLDNTGTLLPGFYKIVATDNTGQQQSNWLYHEAPTEVSKVLLSSMSQDNNVDGSVTLSWGLPASPPLDPAKHFLRVYVTSSNDYTGNGSGEVLFMSHLSATTGSYTIPAAEVTRLKNNFDSLYWQVRIRESDPYVTNPDGSIRSYNIYTNNGPYKSLILP